MASVGAGIVDETLWQPLPFAGGRRLVTLYHARPSAPSFQVLSAPDFQALRDRLRGDVELAGFVRVFQTLGGRTPARVQGELVSDNYFAVLGARPFLGSLIGAGDERTPPGNPAAVLACDFWQRQLGADPSVVGRTIRLNQADVTVVGIAPPGFHGPSYPSQFWIPLSMAQQVFGGLDVLSRPDVPILQTVGRLRDGVDAARTQGLVQALQTGASADGWRLAVLPAAWLRFWPGYRETVGRFVGLFAALAGLVLVVACANLAGLFLARAGERQRELAIRSAVGATRLQIVRRLWCETAILWAAGSVGALAIVWLASGWLERVSVPAPVQIGLTPGARLAAITAAVSVSAFVIVTALFTARARRTPLWNVLAASGAHAAPRSRTPRLLVVAQVAVSGVCLVAAGLLARTALAVERIDIGFDPSHVAMGHVGLGDQGYGTETGTAFYERLQEDLAAQPGVEAAALEWNAVLGPIRSTGRFTLPGGQVVQSRYNAIGPGYLAALRVPLVGGREFTRADRRGAEPVALVNETLAARLGAGALGQVVTFGTERTPRRVVGVVRDMKYNGITEPAQPFVYLPLGQVFRSDAWVYVRTRAAGAEALLRSRMRVLDPNLAVSDLRTLSEQLDQARSTQHVSAGLSGGMAAVAVLLALVGVYGLVAASVDRQRRELAIRAALGASPRSLLEKTAIEGLWLVGAGLAAGTTAGYAASGLLASLLYGVKPHDPAVFLLAPILLLVVSAAAWLPPARRAASADPATVLKAE
jgi:predicted permease